MSELKAISGHEIREDIDYNTRGIDPEDKEWCKYGKELCDTLYYLKSEADAVIKELKAKKSQAEDDCAYWKMSEGNAVTAMHETEEYAMQLYNELRHQKYKRCLAMAQVLEHVCPITYRKARWQNKWYQRWLELANKFKEAK